jgi:hypothetical protein
VSFTMNLGPLLAGMGHARRQAEAAARKAVDDFGEVVLGNAQEICPIESGALQASATATRATIDSAGNADKRIGFNTRYAAARHERPPTTDAPPRQNPRGQWKFLETAVREAAPKMGPFVAARVKAAGGGGSQA